jgi:hypothetical protein
MKNPATLPSPSIRAAHAFPSTWSDASKVSTISARSTACTSNQDVLARNLFEKLSILTSVDGKIDQKDSSNGKINRKVIILEEGKRCIYRYTKVAYRLRVFCRKDRSEMASETQKQHSHHTEAIKAFR